MIRQLLAFLLPWVIVCIGVWATVKASERPRITYPTKLEKTCQITHWTGRATTYVPCHLLDEWLPYQADI